MQLETEKTSPSSESLLSVLQCPQCFGDLAKEKEGYTCSSCSQEYPLHADKFPVFLTAKEQAELDDEVNFWEESYGDTIYENESEAGFELWRDLMQVLPTDKVIELGCGSGAQLVRLNCSLKVGLEPTPGLLTKTTGFHGVIGRAERLPFKDNSFDLAYFKHSLHHVPDKRAGMEEAMRIVKPGGRVLAIEPNLDHPQRRLISNPESSLRKLRFFTKFIGPVESFQTLEELKKMAAEIGLMPSRESFVSCLYESPSFRQRLQAIYASVLKPVVAEKYLIPDYFVEFVKPTYDN